MIVGANQDRPLTLATEPASRGQWAAAIVTTGLALAATMVLLPYAALPGPVIPGFLIMNQTALLIAYGLGSWVLYAQFRRGRSLSLLLAATASLFTAGIMALQFASFPGVFAPGNARLLGTGRETTTWLWTFWHAGPVALGLGYAATVRRERAASFAPERTALAVCSSIAGALLLTAALGVFSIALLPWLPQQTNGDNYVALVTSGVGPFLLLSTIMALGALWWTTRVGRTVLELWIAVSLALLALHSLLTQLGMALGTVGWYAGRIGALISALTVLWAYLHEVNATYSRAEKLAASERLRIEEALRHVQKMEAVGHLTSGISHDFNNLLTVINSAFELILKRRYQPEEVAKMADLGLNAVNKGTALTAQLLSFSGRKALRPKTVNPNTAMADFQAMALRAVPVSVRLEWRFESGAHPVVIDTLEFETALLNLIVNARDAMGSGGGRIDLSTRNATLGAGAMPDGARPNDEALAAGAYVVISITDDGPGMPEGVAARAFDPFFTTKETGKGTGLGLAQVYGFAHSAGGLAVICTAPSGTTIELWLPQIVSVNAHTAESNSTMTDPTAAAVVVHPVPAAPAAQ